MTYLSRLASSSWTSAVEQALLDPKLFTVEVESIITTKTVINVKNTTHKTHDIIVEPSERSIVPSAAYMDSDTKRNSS